MTTNAVVRQTACQTAQAHPYHRQHVGSIQLPQAAACNNCKDMQRYGTHLMSAATFFPASTFLTPRMTSAPFPARVCSFLLDGMTPAACVCFPHRQLNYEHCLLCCSFANMLLVALLKRSTSSIVYDGCMLDTLTCQVRCCLQAKARGCTSHERDLSLEFRHGYRLLVWVHHTHSAVNLYGGVLLQSVILRFHGSMYLF